MMVRRESEGNYEAALPGRPWPARRRALRTLFEGIEPRYDRLNRWLSFGIDQGWRRWAVRSITTPAPGPWLDLASGTGDLAAFAVERLRREDRTLVRSDLSPRLLRVGAEKPPIRTARGLAPGVAAEMDRLPFPGGSFSAVLQGFALRHCEDYAGFFRELHRILAPGGQVAILDMRYPRSGPWAGPYRLYFSRILPRLAGLFGADRSAYQFMVDSVMALPDDQSLIRALAEAGFVRAESRHGVFGAVALFVAWKSTG